MVDKQEKRNQERLKRREEREKEERMKRRRVQSHKVMFSATCTYYSLNLCLSTYFIGPDQGAESIEGKEMSFFVYVDFLFHVLIFFMLSVICFFCQVPFSRS